MILGQDPYHGPNQAHGLCFSVKSGIEPPPYLKNIYKEMKKVLATAALMIGMSAMADAQTVIMNESMSQDGMNVTVTMDIDTDQTNLPSRRKEVIMP